MSEITINNSSGPNFGYPLEIKTSEKVSTVAQYESVNVLLTCDSVGEVLIMGLPEQPD